MTELSRMIATKKVSPVEVLHAHLDRIAAIDGKLKCYITVMGESALAAARTAEAAVQSGADLGPLHGVPVGLKDLYCTKGVKTTGGSKILGDWVPEEDATVVARLAGAGAIALGKLNMRIRLRARGPQSTLRDAVESLGREGPSHLRRIVVRLGRVRGGGHLSGSSRFGHRRIHSASFGSVRNFRHQADLWPGEPRGRVASGVVHGSRGADVPKRGRSGAHARAHGGLRSP
jgi:hypothetical protein